MNKYSLSFKTAVEFLKYIEEQDVQFIDLNFTDIRGKWQHVTKHANNFTKDLIESGVSFDNSKMMLKADLTSVTYDPFAAQKTIKIFCDMCDHETGVASYNDPRSIAKAAEKYLKKFGVADTAFFSANPEFYIFNDIQINMDSNHISYKLDAEEGVYNKGREYPTGNMGHRHSEYTGAYAETPVDNLCDIRAEILTVMESMGVSSNGHSHGDSASQCKMEVAFASLLKSSDVTQVYKHVVHNVANSYGRTATFMPKPINDDVGSGMCVNQSLWKAGKPLFSGKGDVKLSDNALYYIGGLLKHAGAISAFANPTTNSYKRLYISGNHLGYSLSDEKAFCYVPLSKSPKNRFVQMPSPDPTANPYLAFSAMLMAGLDGIDNKIHPGEEFELGKSVKNKKPMVTSLVDALLSLKSDCDFLLKGNVFTVDFIDGYIKLKTEEIRHVESITHPIEVDMYYSS